MKMNKIVLGLVVFLIVAVSRNSVGQTGASGPSGPKASGAETVVLSRSNTLVLNGEVNGESTSGIIASAKKLDDALNGGIGKLVTNNKHLYLFLNTPGGSVQSGLEMIEALKGIGRPVDTITLFAASMGFQIAQNLDDRLILKNGILMSHHATGEFVGSFGGIQPSQVDSRYKLWLDRVRELDEQTVSRTNGKQTYESYTKQYDHEMWLTGTKSVEQGYADRIVAVKCDSTLSGSTTKHASFLGFDIAYDLDNCPLNTSPMNVRISQLDGKALSNELLNEVKNKFLSQFENKQAQVLPMVF
jgi:ATP-dependent Clp protease protease subunit